MTSHPVTRLPAAQRRQALVETAARAFSARSYRGVTTAEIAREAGISEPILYRHFSSKRDLYLACVDAAWQDARAAWQKAVAQTAEPAAWIPAMARAAIARHTRKAFLSKLWIQALSEAGDDPEIRAYLRGHIREVHSFVADVIRRAQDAGAVPHDRDASAEAWIFLAGGLLATFAQRLGGVPTADDFAAIVTQRRRWLTPGAADRS